MAKKPLYNKLNSKQYSKLNATIFVASVLLAACGPSSPQRHMTLAERFWSEENYQAAIQEYEKAIQKDPDGELSYVAKIRIASTYEVFLNQPAKAIQYYELANQQRPNSSATFGTEIQIIELMLNSLNDPVGALAKIQPLMSASPAKKSKIRLLKLKANALAKLSKHQEYRETLRQIQTESSSVEDKAQAEFEILSLEHTLLLSGGGGVVREPFKKLANRWNDFIVQFPEFGRITEAIYFQAWCLEEAGQMSEALKLFESIENTYPARGVITIKIKRVKERLERKGNAFGGKKNRE